jgi:RND family efflux transporter MFP subunit
VSSGELIAKNSENIDGPEGLRQVGIWQVKIQDLVAEGSLVEAGDYVAALDQTEISGKIKDTGAELEKAESQFLQAKLDTTLTLRAARDEILNMAFNLTQKELTLEQSRFEPPAIIRQAELELEKIKRDMVQIQENYKVKKQQAEAKMAEAGANLQQIRNKMDNLQRVFGEFTIRAPKSGMVIYMREWNGQKKKVGSTISPWDPAVATLPDLRYMLSKTYVNEVDIRKLAINQPVSIGLDAFPDLKLKGKVNQVANVGEQKGNTDSKVFEVVIEVLDTDTNVRPGMTTSNRILTATVKDTLVIPLEAVFNQDSISFVYRKSGLSIEKQEIRLGSANENEVIVVDGVKEGDKLLLTEPKTMLDKPITRLTTSSNQAIAKAKP